MNSQHMKLVGTRVAKGVLRTTLHVYGEAVVRSIRLSPFYLGVNHTFSTEFHADQVYKSYNVYMIIVDRMNHWRVLDRIKISLSQNMSNKAYIHTSNSSKYGQK